MSPTLTPYLSFDGTTREAFAFYERALGARTEAMMRYADMPAMPEAPAGDAAGCAGGPPPSGDGIMHACLRLPGGAMLFAGDVPPGMPFEGMKGLMLALQYDGVDEAQRVFAALSDGGTVTMPLAPTFWARTFGMLTDRFGVSWAVNGGPIAAG
jgi:PhnB protein